MKLEKLKNNTKAIFACVTGASALLYIFVTLLICGFGGGSSFWISFVFALISIALAGYVSYHSVKAAKKLTDWIFSLPVLRWCLIYVAAEIVLSTVFTATCPARPAGAPSAECARGDYDRRCHGWQRRRTFRLIRTAPG